VIRRIDTTGRIFHVAGTGTSGYGSDNIQAAGAQLNWPMDLATDSAGNLYVSDRFNNRVRRIGRDGLITTYAGAGNSGREGTGSRPTRRLLATLRGWRWTARATSTSLKWP